jgi:sulfate transport system permease protein
MSVQTRSTQDPLWARLLLTGVTLTFLGLFLFVPLASVFVEAFRKGLAVYAAAITEENARSAIVLTLTLAAICVPLNAV